MAATKTFSENSYKKYKVLYNNRLVGETIAVSPKQAINHVRFRKYGKTCSNTGFHAVEIK